MDIRDAGIIGTFFHAPTSDRLEILEDVLIVVDGAGVITAVLGPDDPERAGVEEALTGCLTRLPEGHFGLPGMVDLHIHAPQYPQLGLALDEPLEIWLQKYTFPLEARYADLDFARQRYSVLVDDLIANGTTTARYFATQHEAATRLLADICIEKGQRALVARWSWTIPPRAPISTATTAPQAPWRKRGQ